MPKNLPLYLLIGIIIGLAFYFRVFPAFEMVFPENGKVYLLGVDPYFYLRHIETTLHNFPALQKFDHATHYPNGIVSDATGLYTLILAFMSKVFLGSGATSDEVARMIAWVPPVVSCIIFISIFLLGKSVRNPIAGLYSLLVLLLYPGLFLPRSLLGFPDHHVIEVMLCILMILSITVGIRKIQENSGVKVHAIIAAIPFISIFFVWQGAPLYIIVIGIIFINTIILSGNDKMQLSNIANFSLVYFISASSVYAMIQVWYPEIITSAFTKYNTLIAPILGMTGIILYAASLLKVKLFRKGYSTRHKLILLFVEITGVYLFLRYTAIGREVFQLLNFRDPNILENRPVGWLNLLDMVSIPGLLALLSAFIFLIKSIIKRSINLQMLPSVFGGIFFTFFWLNTFDMGYMLTPFISILTGVLLYDITYFLIAGKDESNLRFRLLKIPMALLLLFTIVKPFIFHSTIYPFSYTENQVQSTIIYSEAWMDGMDWMKENTPDLQFPTDQVFKMKDFDPDHTRQYGVLSAWDFGNIINQRGKRVPVWSRWPGVHKTKALFMNKDSIDTRSLCRGCNSRQSVKYLVTDAKTANGFFPIKYNNSVGNLFECQSVDTFSFNNNNLGLPTFKDCYENSLIYSLYRGVDMDTTTYRLVWQSEQLSASGYLFQNNKLVTIDFPVRTLDPEFVDRIKTYGIAPVNNGMLYNGYVGPEVKIYEVLNPPN